MYTCRPEKLTEHWKISLQNTNAQAMLKATGNIVIQWFWTCFYLSQPWVHNHLEMVWALYLGDLILKPYPWRLCIDMYFRHDTWQDWNLIPPPFPFLPSPPLLNLPLTLHMCHTDSKPPGNEIYKNWKLTSPVVTINSSYRPKTKSNILTYTHLHHASSIVITHLCANWCPQSFSLVWRQFNLF